MARGKAKEVTHVKEIFRPRGVEGTVIRSWLLDLMVEAHGRTTSTSRRDRGLRRRLRRGPLDGETRPSTTGVAVPNDHGAALFARFESPQQQDSPAMKMVAAMRNQFGGHAVKTD